MKKRIHVYYSGRVQGVGFRFTIEKLSQQLNLTGWVKNLPDGRVETICEGSEEDLSLFLEKVKKIMGEYVARESVDWTPATGGFKSFDIAFF